jgi:hypothetical protein
VAAQGLKEGREDGAHGRDRDAAARDWRVPRVFSVFSARLACLAAALDCRSGSPRLACRCRPGWQPTIAGPADSARLAARQPAIACATGVFHVVAVFYCSSRAGSCPLVLYSATQPIDHCQWTVGMASDPSAWRMHVRPWLSHGHWMPMN